MITQVRQAWEATGHRHRSWWIAAVAAVLLVAAVFVFGVVSMLAWLVGAVSSEPARADELTLRQVDLHDRDAGLVAMFARWCVKLYEEATPATLGQLRQCFTVPPRGTAASPNAATATDLDAGAPILVGEAGGARLWSVLVGVTVHEFTAPSAVRKFVWLSVVLDDTGGPRATLLPSDRAAALPAGPDVELAYTHEVAPASTLAGVINGFIGGYLVGPADTVAQFVTAESGLTGLGQLYDAVHIESMTADTAVDGPPAPGQQVHVLVTVTGSHAAGGSKAMQYPLLLVEAGGRWAVAAVEDMPAVTGRLLAPAG